MAPAPGRLPATGQNRPCGGLPQPGWERHRATPPPALPGGATSSEPGPDELAELDGLAHELNRLKFPSLRLTPPGELPYVDVSQPGSMAAGERIYVAHGMFAWATGEPIGPTGQPVTTATIIAGTLHASGRSRS